MPSCVVPAWSTGYVWTTKRNKKLGKRNFSLFKASKMYRQSDRGNHWRKTEGYSRSFLETTERSQDEYEDPRGSQRNYPKDHMGRGYGRPPGLRGKDIGLYYARKHKEKMNNPDGITRHRKRKVMMKLTLDQRRMDRIQEMLRSIKTPYLRGIEQSEIKKTEGGSGNSSDSPFLSAIENVSKSPFLSAIENVSKSPFLSANENVSNVEAKYAHLGQSRFKDNFLQNITGSIQTKLEQATTMRTQLPRCPDTDRSLKDMLMGKKENSKKYQEMLKFRKKLPSYDKEQEILNLIRNNQVILISGETGCGKTTQVAQFILDDYIMRGDGSLCHVVCTQPRRISAISVACRVADERDETIGSQSVGYQIRLELSIPPSKKGSILYCTTGILLQWMRTDPALLEVSHLVLDEIHERDVLSDFVLTILKDVLPKRPDLKVILMSATLNSEQFSKYYNNCPSINIPGFTYPVEELYLEDVLQITGFNFPPPQQPMHGWQRHLKKNKRKNQESDDYYNFIEPHVRQMQRENKYSQSVINGIRNPESEVLNVDLIVSLIKHICFNKEPGAILVFIPGWTDITKLHSALQESGQFPEHKYLIIPLHSMMPTLVQRSVFDRPPPGVRKIVIATNIAETSITIDDVVYVIDCGKIKMKNFDAVNNIATLKAEWVSLANARQRRGRAGRVQPGVCYHLYSRAREMTLDSYPLPEMLRTRLEEVILQLKILQLGMTEPFLKRVIDPPQPNVVHLSLKLLRNLNALDDNENLTPLGYHLARLPLDPQIGKMILMSSIFSCIDPIFSIAACLSFKDPFYIPLGKEKEVTRRKKSFAEGLKSDHLVLAEVMSKWEEERYRRNDNNFCYQNFLSRSTLNMINDMKQQFARYLHEMNFLKDSNVKSPEANVNSNNLSLVKAVVCSGLYPNVAIIRSAKRNLKTGRSRINIHTPEDGRVQIHPKSVNETEHEFESPFLLYYEKLQTMSKNLLDTGMVYPLPLLFFGQGVTYSVEDGHGVVAVNDSIAFNSCESNANIIKDLRLRLDRLLEYKITHPGCVNWRAENEEAALLRAIIELITIEEQMIIGTGTDDDDLDDFSD